MTVSHMFFDRKVVDCQVNLQVHQRNQALPKPDEKIIIDYDLEDPGFKAMVEAIILGTYTQFIYDPSEDECKQLYARMRKVAVASLEHTKLSAQDDKEMKARLIVAESKLLNVNRRCKGDASETGLVQFAQSVMDIDERRKQKPVHNF